MRVALVSPLAEAVPPKLYGGTERVVSWLAEELVRQEHDVTLFASADSVTSAHLVACAPESLRLAGVRDHLGGTLAMLKEVRRRADDFDVIHFHVDILPNALFHDLAHKCLTTLHGRLDLPDTYPLYEAYPEMPLVSISNAQRRPMPKCVDWLATVQHGSPSICNFEADGGDYLAFLGRISPEKRPDRAIEIAKRAGRKLRIAAKVDNVDFEYFKTAIEPMMDHPLIEFVGEINDVQKCEFLSHASALLFPIDWPEPFGLVMIEAMSAGTPVIAWREGSVPEVITDGVSGIVVDSMEEAVAAAGAVNSMSRAGVYAEFTRRFSAGRMAQDYVAAYRALLARRAARLPLLSLPASRSRAPAFRPERRPVATQRGDTPLAG